MSVEGCFLDKLRTAKARALQNELASPVKGCPDGEYDIVSEDYCKICTMGRGFVGFTVLEDMVISVNSEISGKCPYD